MATQRRAGSRGFSLMELLVVVGIITVLVSIAAPNYQEAITRSKRSKVFSDTRTLETGMELYYTDNGTYPPPDRYPLPSECDPWRVNPPMPEMGFASRLLSTPVSYLAKIPLDPFQNKYDQDQCYPERRAYTYSTDTTNNQIFGTTNTAEYAAYTYIALKWKAERVDPRSSVVVWMMSSCGPDLDRDHGRNTQAGIGADPQSPWPMTYDPSNGTTSNGDIFRFGPGIGIPEDR